MGGSLKAQQQSTADKVVFLWGGYQCLCAELHCLSTRQCWCQGTDQIVGPQLIIVTLINQRIYFFNFLANNSLLACVLLFKRHF